MRTVNGKTRFLFKELEIGHDFRFASEEDMPYSGLATGPWTKISPRKYIKASSECGKHDEYRVGSWNTEVIPEVQP